MSALHEVMSPHFANLDGPRPRPAAGESAVDSQAFRQVMGGLPTGISVLTVDHDGGVWGMTVGSLTSVSLHPALISVCLRSGSTTLGLLGHEDRFALSILAADQQPVADAFAGPRRGTAARSSRVGGLPVISGSVGWLICRHRHTYTAGDHAIVIGSVLRAGARDAEPLVRHASRYRRLA